MQLPKALPDESLFSRMCRHLAISDVSPNQTLQRFLDDGRAVIHPYLTSNLLRVSQFTDESARKLLVRQTLRPLFANYLPQYHSAICDVAANSNEIVRASQLSTFRDKEHLSVKHCPQCARDDVHNYGVAYWHLIHQVPGLEACPKHQAWLVHNELPNRNHVDGYFLPNPNSQQKGCENLAREFAEYVEQKLNSKRYAKLDQQELSEQYLRELSIRGGVTNGGRVRRKKLAQGLFELSDKLFPSPSSLSHRSPKDFRYFSSLLSGQFPQHPFKHLLLEFYLFHCQSDEVFDNTKVEPSFKEPNDEKLCCDLLRSGLSMAAVSREIEKSRCYVKSIALKHDIAVNLKPKMLTESIKELVVQLATKGFHRSVIAKSFGISTGSVELIISTTDGLVEWRKRCKMESLRRKYRFHILRFIHRNPKACRQEIKYAHEAAFHWLYTHEHDWLESILPAANKAQHVDRVDWRQRDTKVAITVRNLLSSSNTKSTRSELDRLLGGHGWLTSKIEKLPKTKALLLQHGLFS